MRSADARPPGAVALGLALLLSGVAPHFAVVRAQDPEQVQRELEQLREDIGAITERLERQRRERDREQQALAAAEKELGRIDLALRDTRARLAAAEARADSLEAEIDALVRVVEERRDMLGRQLRVAYRTGLRSRLKAILDQEDPARMTRVLTLHGYLGRARIRAIEELDARRRELESLRNQQRRLAIELAELAERRATEAEAQNRLLTQRAEALQALESTIRNQTDRLAELRESAARLEALLQDLSTALADIPPDADIQPFDELRGQLPMPLGASVLAGFADARSGDVAWEGWLIDAGVGDPVRAVAYGRVAYADWLRGYGMMVIIDHGDGYMTLYGQNRSLTAAVGDWVEPGEVIALAGDSGGATTPGLYFQIRSDGRPVDPAGWIDR